MKKRARRLRVAVSVCVCWGALVALLNFVSGVWGQSIFGSVSVQHFEGVTSVLLVMLLLLPIQLVD